MSDLYFSSWWFEFFSWGAKREIQLKALLLYGSENRWSSLFRRRRPGRATRTLSVKRAKMASDVWAGTGSVKTLLFLTKNSFPFLFLTFRNSLKRRHMTINPCHIVEASLVVALETVYCSGNCFSLFGASEVRGSPGTRRAELNPKTLRGGWRWRFGRGGVALWLTLQRAAGTSRISC